MLFFELVEQVKSHKSSMKHSKQLDVMDLFKNYKRKITASRNSTHTMQDKDIIQSTTENNLENYLSWVGR